MTRLTAGYVIDRLSGNTGGLAGPTGLLYAIGERPSEFDYLPPIVVLKRFFARSRKVCNLNLHGSMRRRIELYFWVP